MRQADIPAIVRRWIEAYNAHDAAAVAALYAADGVYEDIAQEESSVGPEIEGYTAKFIGEVDGLTIELEDASEAGNRAWAAWSWTGRNAGAVPGDDAAGKPLKLRVVTIFELSDAGGMQRSADYYDTATLMRQAGTLPAE